MPGDPGAEANAHRLLGVVDYSTGRFEAGLGDAHADLDDTDAARGHWRRALDIYRDLGVPDAADVRAKLSE